MAREKEKAMRSKPTKEQFKTIHVEEQVWIISIAHDKCLLYLFATKEGNICALTIVMDRCS